MTFVGVAFRVGQKDSPGKIRSKCRCGMDGTRVRQERVEHGAPRVSKRRRRRGAKTCALRNKKSNQIFEWSRPAVRPGVRVRHPQRNKVEGSGSKSFRGYFHNGHRRDGDPDGRTVHRCHGRGEVRVRRSGAQISAASLPMTHPPLRHQC